MGGPYGYDAYAEGYFDAGMVLIECILEGNGTVDIAVYPLVFIYRHGSELSLKYLGLKLPTVWGESADLKMTCPAPLI